MSPVMLVGESPGPGVVRRPSLWLLPDESARRHTANRLRDLAGWSTREFVELFPVRTNVWTHLPPLPAQEGRDRAGAILQVAAAAGIPILALGGRARDVLGLTGAPPLSWRALEPGSSPGAAQEPWEIAWMNHPSGACRWWNDPDHRRAARIFLLDARRRHLKPNRERLTT